MIRGGLRAAVMGGAGGRPTWLPSNATWGHRWKSVDQHWIAGRRFNSTIALQASGLATSARNSPELVQRADGSWFTASANEVAYSDAGLQVYSQYTTLLPYGTITSAHWSPVNGGVAALPVITANYAAAPDGTQTATRVQFNLNGGSSSSDFSQVQTSNTISYTSGTPQLFTVWMRTTDGSTKTITILPPSGVNPSTATITGAWAPFTASGTPGSTSTGVARIRLRGGEGTSSSADILVWTTECNNASIANPAPIINNTGSPVTRNADALRLFYPAGTYNITTIFADGTSTVLPNVAIDASGWLVPTQTKVIDRIYGEISTSPPISLYSPQGEWEPVRTDLMTLVSNAVSAWNDVVAAASFTNATSNLRPTYSGIGLNNHPAILFDGVDDYLRTASQPYGTGATPQEFLLVLDQQASASDTSERVAFCIGGTTAATRVKISRIVTSGVNRIRLGVGNGTSEQTIDGMNVDASGPLLIHAIITATTAELRVGKNGSVTSEGTISVVPAIGSSYLTIGGNNAATPAGPWKGQVGAMGIKVTTLLTAPQIAALETSLMQAWNL